MSVHIRRERFILVAGTKSRFALGRLGLAVCRGQISRAAIKKDFSRG